MENQSRLGNIASLAANPRSRMVIAACAGVVVVIGGIAVWRINANKKSDAVISGASVQAPANGPNDPAKMGVSPRYASLVVENDRERAAEADRSGGSTMPTVITSVNKNDLAGTPLASAPPPPIQPAPPPPAPRQILADRNPNPTPQADRYTPPYNPQPTAHNKGDEKRAEALAAQVGSMLKNWSSPGAMKVVVTETPASSSPSTAPISGLSVTQNRTPAAAQRPLIQAGTLAFGVIDRRVSSDEPGPVTATLVNGEWKGAKLLGEFKREQTNLLIVFKAMSMPDGSRSMPINAFAVSQATDGYGVQTAVNNHYLERYGLLLAASLMKGVSEAYARSGATVTSSALGGSTTTYDKLEPRQIAAQGLGEVGKTVATAMASNFGRPPTVEVGSGTPIGVLFVADVLRLPDGTVTTAANDPATATYTNNTAPTVTAYQPGQIAAQAAATGQMPPYNPPTVAGALARAAAGQVLPGPSTPPSLQPGGIPFNPAVR